MGSKYENLGQFLDQIKESVWEASFAEIERIVGSVLPGSARAYDAWWRDEPNPKGHKRAWLERGWRVRSLERSRERVVFERDASSRHENARSKSGSGVQTDSQANPQRLGHDAYGKQLLKRATDFSAAVSGASVLVDYGSGTAARIDGTLGDNIAIEVESRVSKQVRGAVMDLVFHSYPRKLLVLLPVHMSNPKTTAAQCKVILHRLVSPDDFQVVLATGNGNEPRLETDAETVRAALRQLGWGG